MRAGNFSILLLCGVAFGQITVENTATCSSSVQAAAATALTESPTSNVPGKAFDRIMMVYLETTSYGNATADRKFYLLLKLERVSNSILSQLRGSYQTRHFAVEFVWCGCS